MGSRWITMRAAKQGGNGPIDQRARLRDIEDVTITLSDLNIESFHVSLASKYHISQSVTVRNSNTPPTPSLAFCQYVYLVVTGQFNKYNSTTCFEQQLLNKNPAKQRLIEQVIN